MTEHDHAGQVATLTGDEAVSRFVDMFLAGYMSGVGTAIAQARALADRTQGVDRVSRSTDAEVEAMSRNLVQVAAEDPLFVEEIRREVSHILVCSNTGPERWKTRS